MPNDIGAKIGLDGAKQFNSDLKNITQTGKTLSAQMKALSASFDGTTDKEEALQKATENLNKQVEAQKKKIDLLKDAVDKSARENGEFATQTLKLQEKLAKAEAELSKLENTTAESALGMKDLAEQESKAGHEADGASGKVSAFTVALGNLAADAIKSGIQAIGDAVKAVGKFFVDATKNAAAFADELLTLSAQTSLSTDTLQEYQYMASLTDTSLETITGSLTKLTRNMASAKDGTGAAAETFAALGVSVTDSEGNLRSADAVFGDVIEALRGIDNEAERDAASMNIFGKSAQDLNPLIEAGADKLASLRQEAHDVGYVLSEDTLGALGEVQDGFDRLGLAADSAKNQLGAAIGQYILPYLNELVGAVQNLLKTGDVDGFIDSISESVNDLAKDLGKALPTILKAGGKLVGQLILGINKMLPELVPAAVALVSEFAQFIIENLPTIVNTAVEIIIALVNGLGEQMPLLIPAAIQAVLTIVQGLLSHVGDLVAAALVLIQGIVEGLTSEDGLASILEAIPTLIGALIEGILGNLDKIISAGITLCIQLGVGLVRAIPQLVAMLPRIIQAIWNALKNVDWVGLGRSLLETIGTGILNGASAIYNAVKNAIQGAINFMKNLGSQAFQWGKDMLAGFGRGIMNAANALWEKVKAIAEKIRGFLHFSRPDFGPLRDYEQWMPDFMKGLAKGIDANAWRVEDAMKGVASDMTLKGGSVTNVDGVSVVINTTPNQDANAIAQQVIAVMTNELNAKRAVFA